MKRILLYCLLALSPILASAEPTLPARDSVEVDTRALADSLICYAKTFLGTPYVWAANGPKSFDCTGFTKYVYARFGYKLGRTVPAQAKNGREVSGGFENLQKGDILIFGRRGNKRAMGHAAIYIGPDESGNDFNFIHAAKRGVIITNYSETYYRERFLGAVRILPDFVPEEPQDSIGLSFTDQMVVAPDTLHLGPEDRRIVLLEQGGWAFVGADGAVSAPDGDDAIVLYANGQWRSIKTSTHTIPLVSQEPEAAAGVPTRTETESGGTQYHTIKSGDTLSALARRYHTSVDAICRLNGINRNTTLRVGKKLRVK
ncbi:MAG: C40 family peptidase [Bacteroidales bacterium]|nr:C40 family peptidase [Bacteroidales bacterium]